MSIMETIETTGYCVKCKDKREITGEISATKNGGRIAKGPCPECGTTVCRILGKPKA
jgi:hypothetical protein